MKKILYILLIALFTFSCNKMVYYYEEPVLLSIPDTLMWVEKEKNIDYYKYDIENERLALERYKESLENERLELERYNQRYNKNLLRMEMSSPLLIENKGTLVYKVDEVLIIGVASRVEARIIKQVSKQTTDYLVSLTTHTTTGVIYEEVIKVGNIMDMDLKSVDPEAFIINKITDNEQLVDEEDVTYWLWSVTANKVGNYNLIMIAKIKENDPSRDVIIFDKPINVVNKPKKKYSIIFEIPDEIKRYSDNVFKLNIVENKYDAYNFEWGGEGEVLIQFGGKVKIVSEGGTINDKKEIFNYTWWVTPEGKEKVLPFTIKVMGDYEDLILLEGNIIVKKNFKESFNRFIDGAVKRWYWLFTALLIPLISYIRKKYFKKKSD